MIKLAKRLLEIVLRRLLPGAVVEAVDVIVDEAHDGFRDEQTEPATTALPYREIERQRAQARSATAPPVKPRGARIDEITGGWACVRCGRNLKPGERDCPRAGCRATRQE